MVKMQAESRLRRPSSVLMSGKWGYSTSRTYQKETRRNISDKIHLWALYDFQLDLDHIEEQFIAAAGARGDA